MGAQRRNHPGSKSVGKVLLVTLLALVLPLGAVFPALGRADEFDGLRAVIEAERLATGAPGVAVALFEGGQVVFAEGFGSKHPFEDLPVKADTLFRIGSVNKMLTATGLLQQVEAGQITLEEPVTNLVPEFVFGYDPEISHSITVIDTLRHTGGINDFLTLRASPRDPTLERVMTGWFPATQHLIAPPGRMWNYSNPNFYLAGLLIEAASGKYYRDSLREQLFEPLGMTRTYFLAEEVLADGNYAYGLSYSWGDISGDPVVNPKSYDNGWARPAGFGWSSVLDLAAFGMFMMKGDETVLADDLRLAAMSPQVGMEIIGDDLAYGFGQFIWSGLTTPEGFFPVKQVEHGGDIYGFAANVALLPDLNRGVVVLANADGAHFTKTVAYALALHGGLGDPQPPPSYPPEPATFPQFEGWWADPWYQVGPLHLSVRGQNLTVWAPLLDLAGIEYEKVLEPYTKDNFYFNADGFPILLTFLFDETGRPEYARSRIFVSTPVSLEDALTSLERMPTGLDLPTWRRQWQRASAEDTRLTKKLSLKRVK